MNEAAPIQAVIVPVTAFQQNCSLLWCSESMKGAVVDPGGDTAFLPGHGPMSNFAAERESNPFVSDAALEASAS